MIENIKVIESKQFLITVVIMEDKTLNDIKEFTLDPTKNEDAYMLASLSWLDSKSIIEVDGIRYDVINVDYYNNINPHIFIYV